MFRATPLVEIAQEFNRYNPLQIRVEGEDAQRLEFWGVFDADNPQSLIRSLADRTDGRTSLIFDRPGPHEIVIRSR